MILASNQKGLKKLSIPDTLWEQIEKNKILFAYGANGVGKSTIKDLIQKDNLEPHFGNETLKQSNKLYKEFLGSKFLVFDNNFIDKFVYLNDGIQQNQLKIIMKTKDIEELFLQKSHNDEIVDEILNEVETYLLIIQDFNDILSIRGVKGNLSSAKKRFATTFIRGELPYKYEDLFLIPLENHKQWWYEGLLLYKTNNLDYCPWCKTKISKIDDKISKQILSVVETKKIVNNLFRDKTKKIENLKQILKSNTYKVSINVKNIVTQLIDNISVSIEQDKEKEIIQLIEQLNIWLKNDKEIFENIREKVKVLDNITDFKKIDLVNEISNLKFFKTKESLSKNINYFINSNNKLIEGIKDSNKNLYEIITGNEDYINKIIKSLGLKYELKIASDLVVSNGLNDKEKYITLNSSGYDISEKVGNVLSMGEKSTLAFAIFIAEVHNLTDKDTVIIFDDPISSYDIFRRYTSISIIGNLTNLEYKKIILLTHESNFLTSIVLADIKDSITVSLNELDNSNVEIQEVNIKYDTEVKLYKDMLNFSYPLHISERAVALRKLHDLYSFITKQKKKELYKYLCCLVHDKKNDKLNWDNKVLEQIKEIYAYFGVNYDPQIEILKDKEEVYKDINLLKEEIIKKTSYSITLEELVCFRMIIEYIAREESKDYKTSSLWNIKGSNIIKQLENYRVFLNSLMHIDNDEMAWPVALSFNDLKSIPKYVIDQIITIIKMSNICQIA